MDLLARAGHAALLAVPGALTAYLAFNAGGFYPDTVGFAAIVVVQLLVLRVTLAGAPAAGASKLLAVPVVALALLTVWTVASSGWSDAPARALVEAQRVLLYLLLLVLFGSLARRPGDARWALRGVAVALVAVCAAGLATRLLPDVLEVAVNVSDQRLSWPLTYWNALGLMAAIGMAFCAHFAASRAEPLAVQALACAAIPVLAATVFFTFSRGALAASVIAVGLYAALAFSPGVLAALASAAPAAAVAVAAAASKELLDEADRSGAAALEQAHDLALVVGLCAVGAALARVLLGLAARRLAARGVPSERAGRGALRVAGAVSAATVVTLALALDVPGRVADAADNVLHDDPVERRAGPAGELSGRFGDPTDPGRVEHWRVAFDALEADPLRGEGAGTFGLTWARERPRDDAALVENAHSVYAEMASELGIVGLLLLAVALGGLLVAFALRCRGPDRRLYAAMLAGAVAWCAHAALDWHWEMPATAVWLFALGGMAAGASGRERPPAAFLPNGARVVLALALLLVATGPLLVTFSQARIDESVDALYADDCARATDRALAAIDVLAVRPEPYEIIGYCDGVSERPRDGVEAMRRAVDRDPASWQAHLGLAILRGEAGEDPRPALRDALARNPRHAVARAFARRLRDAPRSRWPAVARQTHAELFRSGELSFAHQ